MALDHDIKSWLLKLKDKNLWIHNLNYEHEIVTALNLARAYLILKKISVISRLINKKRTTKENACWVFDRKLSHK